MSPFVLPGVAAKRDTESSPRMINKEKIRALAFDYGNTLIAFSRSQIDACDEAIAMAIADQFGPIDLPKLRALRDHNRKAIYAGDPPAFRENDNRLISAGLVRALYGVEPSPEAVDRIIQARARKFVEVAQVAEEVRAMLGRLRERYALGILSNYPDADCIRESIRSLHMDAFFKAIVVSADLGYVKPHPILFETLVQQMGVPADQILFVGDNWLADIQGAKRAGMQAVCVNEWTTIDQTERKPEDREPDLTLNRVVELEAFLN